MAGTVSASDLLRWRREQLQAGGRASQLDWLLDLAGGVPWQTLQQLRLDPRRTVALARPLAQLEELWQSHLNSNAPLQYLVGCCPWRDLNLEVGPGVLIPRQETELMVELAQALLGAQAPRLWADLGTGSGCLALAMARTWPASQGWAVDCSAEALALARRNRAAYGLEQQVELLEGSWWDPLKSCWGRLDLVLANPPYIPTAVWQNLEPGVRDHEPAVALQSGSDGLDALRAISAGACEALAPGGWLLLEHHHDQSAAVLRLLAGAGLDNCQAHADLEGVKRFAAGRRPHTTDHS